MDPVNVPVVASTGRLSAAAQAKAVEKVQASTARHTVLGITFVIAGFCLIAAFLATRINPTRSAVA